MKSARVLAAAFLAVLALRAGAGAAGPATDVSPLRFGVSARTLADLNRNDVTAGLKVLMQTVAKERGIPFDPNPRVFDRLEDFAMALKKGEIDIVSAPSDDFLVLEQAAPLGGLYSTSVGGKITEEFVVLVKEDRPFRRLTDLRDARLMVLSHPAAGLAPAWLDVELMRLGLPTSELFFGSITRLTKINRVILPVFFGQADACLTTRRGFAMAGELNPQILKSLRVLAVSPELVPGVGAYRRSIREQASKIFREAAMNLIDTVAGKHLLTLFQSDAFVEVSEAEFAPTRAFLAEHARLLAAAARGSGSPVKRASESTAEGNPP